MHYNKLLFLPPLGPIGDGWIEIAASETLGSKHTKFIWQQLKHHNVIRSNEDSLNNSITFLLLSILLTKYIK